MTPTAKKLLAPALFLTLFAGAFTFGPDGLSWFWAGQPGVAVLLAVAAVAMWILLANAQLRAHGRA